jgi:hypothetical protein
LLHEEVIGVICFLPGIIEMSRAQDADDVAIDEDRDY